MGLMGPKRRYRDTGRSGNPGWFAPAPLTHGTGGQELIASDPWASQATSTNGTQDRFSLPHFPAPAAPEKPRGGLTTALRGALDGFTSGFKKSPDMQTWDTPAQWKDQASGVYPSAPPLHAQESFPAPSANGLPTRIPVQPNPSAPQQNASHIQQPTAAADLRHMNGARGRAWRINADGSTTLLGDDVNLRLDSGQFGAPEYWRGRPHIALTSRSGRSTRLDYSEIVFQPHIAARAA